MEEVCDGLHTVAAGGERDEQHVEESGQESHGPSHEDEHNKPDNGPTPLESHDAQWRVEEGVKEEEEEEEEEWMSIHCNKGYVHYDVA